MHVSYCYSSHAHESLWSRPCVVAEGTGTYTHTTGTGTHTPQAHTLTPQAQVGCRDACGYGSRGTWTMWVWQVWYMDYVGMAGVVQGLCGYGSRGSGYGDSVCT